MPDKRMILIGKRVTWTVLFAVLAAPLFGVRPAAVPAAIQEQDYPVGVLHGTVTRDDSAQPIPGVQVTLTARGNLQSQRAAGETAPRAAPPPAPEPAQRRGGGGAPRGAGPRAAAAAQPITMTEVTDGAGQFTFDRVPAGPVSVQAQLQGFFGRNVNGNSPTVVTATGTIVEGKTAELSLAMIPGGTISGRVMNALGQPLSDTPVSVLRALYQNGGVTLAPSAQKTTDDRGEYRLYRLPPGEYYVAATPAALRAPRGAQPGTESPVTTLYPGTTDTAGATLLTLRGGEEYTGIDIQVRSVRLARISGRLIGGSGAAAAGGRGQGGNGAVSIMPRGTVALPDSQQPRSAGMKEDGSFEIQNVLPGSYDLIGRMASATGWGPQNPPEFSTGHWSFGRTPVDVQGADVDGVVVNVTPGFDVRGVVMLDGKPVSPNIRVSLQADNRGRVADDTMVQVLSTISQYQPPIRADGSFSIPLVPDGRYRVQVTLGATPVTVIPAPRGGGGGRRGQAADNSARGANPPAQDQSPPPPRPRENAIAPATPPQVTTIPPTTYIADIRQGSTSIYDNGFNASADPGVPIEIMLGTNPGSVEGTVAGRDQKPFAGATVVLIPAEARRQNPALYKTARTDTQGRFQITLVPPGSYKVFAWENVASGAYQNPQFLERFEPHGAGIDVLGGGAISVQIEALRDDGGAR